MDRKGGGKGKEKSAGVEGGGLKSSGYNDSLKSRPETVRRGVID